MNGTTHEIKERFRNGTYTITHEKSITPDHASFDILEEIKEEYQMKTIIRLHEKGSLKTVMAQIWSEQHIHGFEEKIPSLKEIFIQEVKKGGDHA